MEFIIAALMPLALLYLLFIWTIRLVLPGRAAEIALGVIPRDVFWLGLTAIGALLVVPFRVLRWLVAQPRTPRYRQQRRGQRRRGQRRHGRRRRRRW